MQDYEKIKAWYDDGYMELDKVWNLVNEKITEEEYKSITGLVYPDKGGEGRCTRINYAR